MSEPTFFQRLKDGFSHGWNAFRNRDPTEEWSLENQSNSLGNRYWYGRGGTSYRPDRMRMTRGNEKSIIAALINRIALDVSAVNFRHVRVDQNGNFLEPIHSDLNRVLTYEANIDQTGRELIRDLTISMLDEGCVGVFPTDASVDPNQENAYSIKSLRVCRILEWFPEAVRIEYYSEVTGRMEQRCMRKEAVAIIENPLYSIINDECSVLRRLVHKLNQMDILDEAVVSGKLDVIIQLPYPIKSPQKQEQAETRRKLLEEQMTGSRLGIGYTDVTEKIVQLNRPVENHFLEQVQYWMELFYDQLGMNKQIVDGTADEQTMLNYYGRTRDPILRSIQEAFERKFLTQTARTQNHRVMYFTEPFKLITAINLANLADKLTRNEILTSNEIRGLIGFKPSDDPRANQLVNKNIAMKNEVVPVNQSVPEVSMEGENQNGSETV